MAPSSRVWFSGDKLKTTTGPYLPIAHESTSSSSSSEGSSSSGSSSAGSDRAGSPPVKDKLHLPGARQSQPQRHTGSGIHYREKGRGLLGSKDNVMSLDRARVWVETGKRLLSQGIAIASKNRPSKRSLFLLRKLVSLLLQAGILLGILAFAIYGGYMFITMRWSGRYMRIPVYTKYEIGQAGWQRPLLLPSPPFLPGSLNRPLPTGHSNIPNSPSDSDTAAAALPANKLPSLSSINSKKPSATSLQLYDFDQAASSRADGRRSVNDLHVLVLTPLKNAGDVLDNFFTLLTGLEHPKENISIGFLIGDEEDATGKLVNEWVGAQHTKGDYRKITLLKKDFGLITPGGDARHKNWLQAQRRSLMAKARTLLLTSTLEPSVDWVLWLDSDLSEAPSSLIADLLFYGNAGVYPNNADTMTTNEEDQEPFADVITPNIMRRLGPGQIQGYDLNK